MKKRLLSSFMAVLMVISITLSSVGNNIVAYAVSGSSTYMSGNPYPKYNYETIRSCTSVVWDCVKSNTGISLPGGLGNGGSWFSNASSKGYMTHKNTPQPGDIACYSGGIGHVAYVIDVNTSNATMTLYEGGFDWTDNSGVRHTGSVGGGINVSNNMNYNIGQAKNGDSSHKLQGFIRPKASGAYGEMTDPAIWSKYGYYLGETIDISWNKTSSDSDFYQYWLIIYNETTKKQLYAGDAGSTNNVNVNSYSFKPTEAGDYKITVYAVPYNNKETRQKMNTRTIVVGNDKLLDFGDDFYGLILNNPAWKPISVTDTNNVVLTTESYKNYDRTVWHFVKNSDGGYKITSVFNGLSLDVANGGDYNGANVSCYPYNGSDAQKWYIYLKPDGSRYITAACTSRVFTLLNQSTADNTNVEMWPKNDSDSQRYQVFVIKPEENNLDYSITADKSTVDLNESVKISIGGRRKYIYNYKYHIIDPFGNETVVDNKCNDEYSLKCGKVGKYTVYAEVTNPYYTEIGSKDYKSVTITVNNTEHNCLYETKTVSPTCMSKGYTIHTCSICGSSYTDSYTEPTGHSYNSKITKTASCTEDGVKTFTCKNCDDSYTETIPATGHSYTEKVIAPTTDSKGYTLHTCKNCGDSYKDNYTDPIPQSHTHSYTSKITREATCTQTGIRTYTCSCGDSYTEVIPMKAHSYINKTVAPNCTAKGYTEHTCSVCGDSYRDNEKPAAGHKYVTKTVAPTYTSQGYTEHTCSVCGDSYKDNYKAKLTRKSISTATVSISGKQYVYTGKALKPSFTVKLGSTTLKSGTDYTSTFKSNTNCGQATLTITGKGAYTGTKSVNFIIKPKAVTAKKLTSPKTKQIKLTWAKAAGGVTGYEVMIATNKAFSKGKKTYTVSKAATTSKTVTNLKKGTTYYAKVRAYKTVNGTKYYGAYSAAKEIKCK